MDDNCLQKIQISGPTLASLIQRVSSAPADVDGLLFGRVTHIIPSTLSDDSSTINAPSPDQPTLVATVTSFVTSTATSTFYSPSGHLHAPALNDLLFKCTNSSSHDDRLIGWFSARRKTHLRPSMRETTVTASLASKISPCVFFLLTTPFHDQLIHTHEYKAFQFRSTTHSFDPKTIDVVNLGPAFRGHYGNFTPNSPFPDLPFEVKGLNSESMVEDEEGKQENEKFGSLCHDDDFKIGRLKNLMGPGAANYTAELEELYNNMLKKVNGLAKLVEQSSARVLEQPYLHESRHQHAMRRVRGSGDRFANKTEVDSSKNTTGSVPIMSSSQSVNSMHVHSESAESLETARDELVNSLNNNSHNGGCLGQQWINMSSDQASQRAVAKK